MHDAIPPRPKEGLGHEAVSAAVGGAASAVVPTFGSGAAEATVEDDFELG